MSLPIRLCKPTEKKHDKTNTKCQSFVGSFSPFFQTIANSNFVLKIYVTFIDKSWMHWKLERRLRQQRRRRRDIIPIPRNGGRTVFERLFIACQCQRMICVTDKLLDLRTQSSCGLVCVTNCSLLWYIHQWNLLAAFAI